MFEIPNQLHRSSCTEIYYQCNLQSTHSNMLLELLVQLIKEPYFHTLRTKEQLGYIVFCGIRRANGVQGLRVIVQSDRHPSYVDQRVEVFLDQMEEYISKMSAEEFERNREALAAQRLEKPKKLSILSARFWSEITSQQYNFDRANVEVAHLRTLTKDDILNFYKDLVQCEAPRRHKIAVHVLSMAEGGAGTVQNLDGVGDVIDGVLPRAPSSQPTRIEDITDFKSSQAMFPLVQPFINIRPKGAVSKL